MTENFEKLTFHRKIDILVAMHVMKWTNITIENKEWVMGRGQKYWACYGVSSGIALTNDIPLYSALLTCAWDIVRKFDYCHLFKVGAEGHDGMWECKLIRDNEQYAWAETEQLAICYAGLKAVGHPLKEFLQKDARIEYEKRMP